MAYGAAGTPITGSPPHVAARHSASQSITTTIWSALVFNTEDEDTAAFHSTASNTDRFVIPASGLYLCCAALEYAANSTGQRLIGFQVNGTPSAGPNLKGRGTYTSPSATYNAVMNCSAVNKLTAGDILRVLTYQDSGGGLNVVASAAEKHPFVTLTWVGLGT